MNSVASLLGLTVGNYFNLCNWQLLSPPSNNYLPKQAKIISPQRPIVLSALSVKEFFNSCNWQLVPLQPANDDTTSSLPPLQVESADPNLTALPCLTVTKFFSLCNWHSLPLEVCSSQAVYPSQPLPLQSPLTQPVQAFFQMIPWEGSPKIGGLPQASLSESIAPAQVEMSLNDLAKLF